MGSQGSVTVTPANNSILPKILSPQDLIKLEVPPQVTIPALPVNSNLVDAKSDRLKDGRVMDLIGLYQEAAFNDPVINSARFNLTARKELFWQGLSVLCKYLPIQLEPVFFSTVKVLTVFLIKRATP